MSSALDIGCGDGRIIQTLNQRMPQVKFRGFDVSPRQIHTTFPTEIFDGRTLPLPDSSIDAVLLIDVLHHAQDPFALLKEACRVAKQRVIIKDHRLSKTGARILLRGMDWVGNWAYDVKAPHHYWSEPEWRSAWASLALEVLDYKTELHLYPGILKPIFEDGLHFLARLEKKSARLES
jgi:SAM-dependent methyltransferase